MISVEEHLGLAMTIAWKYYKCYKDKYTYDEIKSTAFLGLVEAVRRFDETKGFKFSTYAIPVIEGRIKREFRDDKWYFKKRGEAHEILSLNVMIKGTDEGKPTELQDNLEDVNYREEDVINSLLVRELFKRLTQKEKEVISLYFFNGLSQYQIGKKVNYSQTSVARTIARSLSKMRKELYKDKVLSA